jgi:tellurite resistance protein TerC
VLQADLVRKHHAARTAADRSPMDVPDLHEHTGKTVDEHHEESRGSTPVEPRETER